MGIVAAALICLVVAGSLLGNSFVAARMTTAASNSGWLPGLLAVVGRVGLASDADGIDETSDEVEQSHSASKSDAPINAILLSAILSTIYILFGNFRALLTFNGLGEYSFFFLTVLGALFLRIREPKLKRPYKPFVIVPAIFAIVSGFVVVRGAVFAPIPAMVLILIWIIGLAYYVVRQR